MTVKTLRPLRPSISDARTRAILVQALALFAVAGLIYLLVTTTIANLQRQGITSGFGFLREQAGYEVSESLIGHSAQASYARTLAVGLVNTLYVSTLGIVLATLLGIFIGLARISGNWLVEKLAATYIEVFRNTPLLLQIVLWYSLLRQLPGPRQALQPLPGVFLSNRGLLFPAPVWDSGYGTVAIGFAAGVATAIAYLVWITQQRTKTGRARPRLGVTFALIALPTVLALVLGGGSLEIDVPILRGFNFRGGSALSPEFMALLVALVSYIGAFIAEIVRTGIQSVAKGQREAAYALGLSRAQIMRLVVMPQALRAIVPPLTSQYVSLVKDSSLAVWIGYPDLVNVATTALNMTGQAIECLLIVMLAYLTISLSISVLMNWYNHRMALRGAA